METSPLFILFALRQAAKTRGLDKNKTGLYYKYALVERVNKKSAKGEKRKSMLEYILEVNDLTPAADDFWGRVVNVSSLNQDQIIDKMMSIGAGLTRSDIVSILEAFKQVISETVADGGGVNMELFNAYPSIHGKFTSMDDPIDGIHRKVKINLQPGVALRDAVSRVKTKRLNASSAGVLILSVFDVRSNSLNHTITPGKPIKVTGSKVKIAGSDPTVGLWFEAVSGGIAVQADMNDVAQNNPSEIIALTPPLAPGTYRVKLVTQYSGGGHLRKTPHTAIFETPLLVQ